MTTITRERLLTIKQWRETYGPGSNVVLPAEEAEELARIALASLEAEPVAECIVEDGGMCIDGFGEYVGHSLPDGTHQLYTAPPAPVVPEEKPMPNPLKMYAVDAVSAIAEVRGWNSCRAAMLHGAEPVSQTYKLNELSGNSPVTPDSWISCSERMPDTKTAVLVAREFDRKGDWRMKWATYIPGHPDANDGWVIPGASWIPSHWMPLPEPPQEVNRG